MKPGFGNIQSTFSSGSRYWTPQTLFPLEYNTDSLAQSNFLTNDTGMSSWVSKASESGVETNIQSLCIFNGKIYGSSYPNGELLEWDGVSAWTVKAPKLNSETNLTSLCVFNNKIYAGTSPNGNLFEWNGTNAWVSVASKSGSETGINFIIVFKNELYGCTNFTGLLLKWNDTNAWTTVAPYTGEGSVGRLVVFNDELYGGSDVHGQLLKWNGTNAWVLMAGQSSPTTSTRDLCVFNNKIYAGTDDGRLLEWNGTNAWVERAAKEGSGTHTRLTVYNNKIYGITNVSGSLLVWNGTDAWILIASQLGTASYLISPVVFNYKLYCGTGIIGNLYEWSYNLIAGSEATIKSEGNYSLKGVALITDSLNKTLTKTFTNLNLTGCNQIKFDIYSTRTGSNIKVGIHDTGGTITEITLNITSANVFQTVTWDISAVSDTDKNTIDSIIVTIVNADTANIFYLDNFLFKSVVTNSQLTLYNTLPLIAECNFRSIVLVNGTYHIFEETPHYTTYVKWTIEKRTSADGLTFSAKSAALLDYGGSGDYDEDGQADPSVIYDGAGDWKMWHDAMDNSDHANQGAWRSIGYATSADGTTWNKQGSVLDKGTGAQWDVGMIHHPCVIKHNGIYYMFYGGAATLWGAMKIGLATSSNGINWIKHANNPIIIGDAGEFDSINVRPSCPILISGIWYMFYWGYNGTNHSIGLAKSTDLITWIKIGKILGNPIGLSGEINPGASSLIINPVGLTEKLVQIWYACYTGVWDNVTHSSLNFATLGIIKG